jgi:hypothetical protein
VRVKGRRCDIEDNTNDCNIAMVSQDDNGVASACEQKRSAMKPQEK